MPMKTSVVGAVAGMALSAFSFARLAAEVTLTGWAFGSGNPVQVSRASEVNPDYNGWASDSRHGLIHHGMHTRGPKAAGHHPGAARDIQYPGARFHA